MSPEEREAYGRCADWFEKRLLRLLAVLAVVLLLAQPLMRFEPFRSLVSEVERGEGIPYGQEDMERWLDHYFDGSASFDR